MAATIKTKARRPVSPRDGGPASKWRMERRVLAIRAWRWKLARGGCIKLFGADAIAKIYSAGHTRRYNGHSLWETRGRARARAGTGLGSRSFCCPLAFHGLYPMLYAGIGPYRAVPLIPHPDSWRYILFGLTRSLYIFLGAFFDLHRRSSASRGGAIHEKSVCPRCRKDMYFRHSHQTVSRTSWPQRVGLGKAWRRSWPRTGGGYRRAWHMMTTMRRLRFARNSRMLLIADRFLRTRS